MQREREVRTEEDEWTRLTAVADFGCLSHMQHHHHHHHQAEAERQLRNFHQLHHLRP